MRTSVHHAKYEEDEYHWEDQPTIRGNPRTSSYEVQDSREPSRRIRESEPIEVEYRRDSRDRYYEDDYQVDRVADRRPLNSDFVERRSADYSPTRTYSRGEDLNQWSEAPDYYANGEGRSRRVDGGRIIVHSQAYPDSDLDEPPYSIHPRDYDEPNYRQSVIDDVKLVRSIRTDDYLDDPYDRHERRRLDGEGFHSNGDYSSKLVRAREETSTSARVRETSTAARVRETSTSARVRETSSSARVRPTSTSARVRETSTSARVRETADTRGGNNTLYRAERPKYRESRARSPSPKRTAATTYGKKRDKDDKSPEFDLQAPCEHHSRGKDLRSWMESRDYHTNGECRSSGRPEALRKLQEAAAAKDGPCLFHEFGHSERNCTRDRSLDIKTLVAKKSAARMDPPAPSRTVRSSAHESSSSHKGTYRRSATEKLPSARTSSSTSGKDKDKDKDGMKEPLSSSRYSSSGAASSRHTSSSKDVKDAKDKDSRRDSSAVQEDKSLKRKAREPEVAAATTRQPQQERKLSSESQKSSAPTTSAAAAAALVKPIAVGLDLLSQPLQAGRSKYSTTKARESNSTKKESLDTEISRHAAAVKESSSQASTPRPSSNSDSKLVGTEHASDKADGDAAGPSSAKKQKIDLTAVVQPVDEIEIGGVTYALVAKASATSSHDGAGPASVSSPAAKGEEAQLFFGLEKGAAASSAADDMKVATSSTADDMKVDDPKA